MKKLKARTKGKGKADEWDDGDDDDDDESADEWGGGEPGIIKVSRIICDEVTCSGQHNHTARYNLFRPGTRFRV